MLPFLVLQLRPETEASDNEFEAILNKGGLAPSDVKRIRLDCEAIEGGIDIGNFSGVIVGGGPGCVSDPVAQKTTVERRIEQTILALMPGIVEEDYPFLGCCYGIGILAHHLGAGVSKERYGEGVGAVECTLTEEGKKDALLFDIPGSL